MRDYTRTEFPDVRVLNQSTSDDGQVILAGDGNDIIYDGAGDDVVSGGDGRDWFYGGAGADSYDGGAGIIDKVLYDLSTVGITVDVTNTANNTGIAAGDSYVDIERIQGSDFDDILIAGGSVNFLTGLAGDDHVTDGANLDRIKRRGWPRHIPLSCRRRENGPSS